MDLDEFLEGIGIKSRIAKLDSWQYNNSHYVDLIPIRQKWVGLPYMRAYMEYNNSLC